MIFKRVGIVLLSLLLAGGLGGCMKESVEKEIVTYLQEKYNEEFIVETYEKKSNLQYEYGADKITAHPKGNDEIVFVAGQKNSKKGGYYDTYNLCKLGNELTLNINEQVYKIIKATDEYKVALYGANEDYDNESNISAFEFIRSNNVDVVLNVVIKVENKEMWKSITKEIYELYNLVANLGSLKYTLSVGIASENANTTEYIRTANANNVFWQDLDEEVYGCIIIDQNSDINLQEDVIEHYVEF